MDDQPDEGRGISSPAADGEAAANSPEEENTTTEGDSTATPEDDGDLSTQGRGIS